LDGREVSNGNSYSYHTDYDSAGTHTVQVDVSDNETTLRRTWTINVENVDRAPVLEPIQDMIVNEGDKVVVNINASDPDGDDILYSISNPIGNDKEWQTTYGDAGIYPINVTVSDGKLTATQTFKLTAKHVDRPPLFKKIDDITLTETEKVKIILDAVDPDEDKVTFSSEGLPRGASLKANVFEYIPDYETVQKPGNWFNKVLNTLHLDKLYYKDTKTFDITLIATGKEKSTNQTFKITVKNVDRPPKLLPMDDIHVKEGETVKLRPVAIDPDNDRLSFSATDPVGKDLKWKTNYNDNGNYIVNVTVSDGELTDTKTVKVFVENVNRLPTIEVKDKVDVNENQTVEIPVIAKDPDGDPVEMYLENPAKGISLKNNTLIYAPGFDTAEQGKTTEVIATIVIHDYAKELVKKSIIFKVKDVDRAPKLVNATPAKSITVKVREPVIFRAAAIDPDEDELTYEWKFGLFDSIKGPTAIKRTFTTPGLKVVKLTISDGESSITKEWKINVIPKPVVKKAAATVKTT
jgi:hypothetical protein